LTIKSAAPEPRSRQAIPRPRLGQFFAARSLTVNNRATLLASPTLSQLISIFSQQGTGGSSVKLRQRSPAELPLSCLFELRYREILSKAGLTKLP